MHFCPFSQYVRDLDLTRGRIRLYIIIKTVLITEVVFTGGPVACYLRIDQAGLCCNKSYCCLAGGLSYGSSISLHLTFFFPSVL
jgi:hypothetical protein